jgi:hypothetical protein
MLSDVAVNPRLVRISILLDPIEGRPDGAWVFEYGREAFVTDKGGGNPAPFVWSGQPAQPIPSRARARPPLVGFDVMTREDIARELRINPALVDLLPRGDPDFPAPIVTFRGGPIWDAEAIHGWAPTQEQYTARNRRVPLR